MADIEKEGTATYHNEQSISPSTDSFDVVDERAIGGEDISAMPARYYRSPQIIGSVLAFALGVISSLAGFVMVSSIMFGFINPDIGPSHNILWVSTAIPLGQSVAFPIVGRLSDIFGRRWFCVIGNLVTLIGWLIGGQASSVGMLIGASVIIGVASAVQVMGSALPGELFPNNQRYLVFVICTAGFFPLFTLGPGIAREFCLHTEQGWRWVYHLYAILTGIATILFFLCYHPPPFDRLHKHASEKEVLKHLDWIGMLLYVGSAVSFLLGLTWGSGVYHWGSAKVIAPTVVGVVGFAVLGIWETFSKQRHPFLEPKLFVNRNWIFLSLISGLGSVSFYGLNILLPQQLTTVLHFSESRAGWASCILPGGITLGWIISGIFTVNRLAKVGITIKMALIAACVVQTAFIGAMATEHLTFARTMVFCIFASVGVGLYEVISVAGAPLEVDSKDMGAANGTQMSLRTICGSIGSAIFVTTLNNKVTSNVAKYVPKAIMETGASQQTAIALAGALASGNATAIAGLGTSLQAVQAGSAALEVALVKSYQVLYYISIAFGLTITVAAICLDGRRAQSKLTPRIPRRLQDVGTKGSSDAEEATTEGCGEIEADTAKTGYKTSGHLVS